MKTTKLISIAFLVALSSTLKGQSVYADFYANYFYQDFSLSSTGGGSVTVEIVGDVLSIDFSGSFSSAPLRTGYVKLLTSSPQIPDMDLGYIGGGSSYFLSLRSGFMYITGDGSDVSGFHENFQVDLVEKFAFSSTENYVITTTPEEEVKSDTELATLLIKDKSINVNYYDGLGRISQTIAKKGSPNQKDMIVGRVYDQYGREPKRYLPLESSYTTAQFDYSFVTSVSDFYANSSNDVVTTTNYYTENEFERSTLNQVDKVASPGEGWEMGSGNEVKYTRRVSQISDGIYNISFTSRDFVGVNSSQYAEHTLYVSETEDEDGNITQEFRDSQGKIICKKSQLDATTHAKTYYLYDGLDRLVGVVPPEAVNEVELAGNDWNLLADDAFKGKWLFLYQYDARGRMTYKKVPGAEPVYLVYDSKDRLVLTQDGRNRRLTEVVEDIEVTTYSGASYQVSNTSIVTLKPGFEFSATDTESFYVSFGQPQIEGEWILTKYDELDRPVYTGKVMISGTYDEIQTLVEGEAVIDEQFTGASSFGGYSNNFLSTYVAENDLLSVTYYDNYNFLLVPNWDEENNDFSYSTAFRREYVSQVTGSVVRVLDSDLWLNSVIYYDQEGRVKRAITENHLGGLDVISTNYKSKVSNQVSSINQSHSTSGGDSYSADQFYSYDHAGRLIEVGHRINDQFGEGTTETISANEYNAIGELKTKLLHGGEQSIDYTYNARGWLTSINDSQLSDPNDLFGMELFYNTSSGMGGHENRFNGNISAVRWSSYDANGTGYTRRGYEFDYDGLNRLTNANHYRDYNSGTAEYDVDIPFYDLNGNIVGLSREGQGGADLDDLSYTYDGNHLRKVTDASSNAEGFDNGSSGSTNDYSYDGNGNMVSDANKGINNIEYNHLNLPARVIFDANNYIEFQYDAAGIKLQQTVYENGSLIKTTDYVGEFIYENNHDGGGRQLQLIQHEEGRIVPAYSGSQPEVLEGYDYQYHLKDHLGNVRVTFGTKAENYEMIAQFEDATLESDTTNFSNVDTPNRVAHPSPTNTGKSARLNNLSPAGPFTVLSVNKGDTVSLSVTGYYEGGSGYSNPVTEASMIASLQDALKASPKLANEGVGASQIDGGILAAITVLGVGGSSNDNVPGAYLNYLIFDREMNYQGIAGFTQISSAASFSEETISINERIMDRDGYLVAYLSNESNTPAYVHFDDFTVYHGKTNVVSTQDYYPFGLTFNEYERTASTPQNYKFGGKEEQEDWGVGVMDFEARFYDGAIGRFMNVDPLADAGGQESWTPYHYTYNNPIAFIDPTGMFGDYYNSAGEHLGSDGIDDDKVYVAESVTTNDEGTVTGATNSTELDVTHTEFATAANVVKHESSGNKEESLWIAHTANNAKDNNAIDWKKQNSTLEDQLTDKQYSTTPSSAREPLATDNNSSSANNARAAVIDVYTGGADPTGGAVLWDGDDFRTKGTSHNKFKEYTSVSIKGSHLQNFARGGGTDRKAAASFVGPIIFKKGFTGTGNSKRGYSLHSTGSPGKGRSIFWKIKRK